MREKYFSGDYYYLICNFIILLSHCFVTACAAVKKLQTQLLSQTKLRVKVSRCDKTFSCWSAGVLE